MSKKPKHEPGSLHSTYKGTDIWRPKPPYGMWTARPALQADTLHGIKRLITKNTKS